MKVVYLVPVMLIVLVSVLLCVPPFRGFTIQLTARCTDRAANVGVEVKRVHLSFPLGLAVQSIGIVAPPSALLSLRDFRIGVHPLPLLGGRILISTVSLHNIGTGANGLVRKVRVGNALKGLCTGTSHVSLKGRVTQLGGVSLSSATVALLVGSAAAGGSAASATIG